MNTETTPKNTQMFVGDFDAEIDVFLQAFQNCVEADRLDSPLSDFSLQLTLDRTDITAVTFGMLKRLNVTRLSRPPEQALLARVLFSNQPTESRFSAVNTLLLQISAEISRDIEKKTDLHFQRQKHHRTHQGSADPSVLGTEIITFSEGNPKGIEVADLRLNITANTRQPRSEIDGLKREITQLRTQLGQTQGASDTAAQAVDKLGDESAQTARQVRNLGETQGRATGRNASFHAFAWQFGRCIGRFGACRRRCGRIAYRCK